MSAPQFQKFDKLQDAADAFFKEAKNLQEKMLEAYNVTGKIQYDYNNIKVYKSYTGEYYYLTMNLYGNTREASEDTLVFELSTEIINHHA